MSEWSKEAGLGPAGVGLRGFEPRPPHLWTDPLQSERIVNFLIFLRSKGYRDSTLESYSRIMRHIAKHCDLDDPGEVKRFIAGKRIGLTLKPF